MESRSGTPQQSGTRASFGVLVPPPASLPTTSAPALPELLEHESSMFPKRCAGKAGKQTWNGSVLQIWLIYS